MTSKCYNSFSNGLKHNPLSVEKTMFCATAQLDNSVDILSWSETRQLVDKVHKHVCGHSSFSDIKVLLQRNGIWNDSIQDYLASTIEKCTSCKTTALPKQERKVSLSSMNRSFNDLVCIDHMFLEDNCVFHIMDSYSRYSAGSVVPSTTMEDAIPIFDAHWISAFWAPDTVLYDRAFNTNMFKSYLRDLGCEMRPIPPRRHNKNVLESKHRIIRDIYLRLKDARKDQDTPAESLFVQQALRISNILYGNEVMSAHELAKGYTYPVAVGASPVFVPDEIVSAQEQLTAKRKLTRIMRSKAIKDEHVAPGDLVEVFIKHDKEKRGSWTSPKPVLSYDHESQTVVVPGKNGRKRTAAIEDTRPAVLQDEFAMKVQEAIDQLNVSLDVAICNATTDDDQDFSVPHQQPDDVEEPDIMSLPKVGDGIEVFWPVDNQFYPGTVASYDDNTGKYDVNYDDGDKESLRLQDEKWRFASIGAAQQPSSVLPANDVELTPGQELPRLERKMIDEFYNRFGNKEFMLHEAQALPSSVTQNAYKKE